MEVRMSPKDAPRSERGPLLGRRAFLTAVGAGAGLLMAGGSSGLPRWLGASPHSRLDYAACLSRLGASLTPAQRRLLVHPPDHPSRQLTNTVAIFDAPHLGTLLDAEQLSLVERLYETMTSESGRRDLANTIGLEGKLEGCVLAIYGDSDAGRAQAMITGGHLMLRGGGLSDNGCAFGGPLAYGQQIGNNRFKVEGNAFAFHSDAANRFYQVLPPGARARSLAPRPPHELVVQAQGADGRFTGVAVRETGERAREEARRLVETVLSTWPEEDRRDAWDCVEHNGGVDALHVTFYANKCFWADGAVYADLGAEQRAGREPPYWQVWRIEGPGTVIHFKGHPHVHAYVNIVRDPARQNVGEVIGSTNALLEPADLHGLVEASLRRETGEALAYYPADDVTARFCPGEITTGLAWALDPYGNRVAVATIGGSAMGEPLRTALSTRGVAVEPDRRYRVATAVYYAGREDLIGSPERVESGERRLRDAIVAELREGGLPRHASARTRLVYA
jgi:hypothetical protein